MKNFRIQFTFWFLISTVTTGIFHAAIQMHGIFNSKFPQSLFSDTTGLLIAGIIILCFPVIKEFFRSYVVRTLFGITSEHSLSLKGLLPGVLTRYFYPFSPTSRKEILCISLLGLFFDLAVISGIGFLYYDDFLSKRKSEPLSTPVMVAYYVSVIAYIDLIINLSPVAKYDLFRILTVGVFKKDPRRLSVALLRGALTSSRRKPSKLSILLAASYLLITVLYLGIVVERFFVFSQQVYFVSEESFVGMLTSLLIASAAVAVLFRIFIIPTLPLNFWLTLSSVTSRLRRVRTTQEQLTTSLTLKVPNALQFVHLPTKSVIRDENFLPEIKVWVVTDPKNVKPGDSHLTASEKSEIFRFNPVEYWNSALGELSSRLSLLLELVRHVKDFYPIEKYQYLFDTGAFVIDKYHYSKNKDLLLRTSTAPIESVLGQLLNSSYRDSRRLKSIIPITIRDKSTNNVELLIMFHPPDFSHNIKPEKRFELVTKTIQDLKKIGKLKSSRIFEKLEELPPQFLEYVGVIPFTRSKSLSTYFLSRPETEQHSWKSAQLIFEIDRKRYVSIPESGYLIPLRFDTHHFGFKIRTHNPKQRQLRSAHPFIRYFEHHKFSSHKYNNYVPEVLADEHSIPYPSIYFIKEVEEKDTLYLFEGEMNAAAFAWMCKRSAVATGGLDYMRIHDCTVALKKYLKPLGYRKIVICFDVDGEKQYLHQRLDKLKDSQFRALQCGITLCDDFDVYFPSVTSGNSRPDNDDLMKNIKPDEYNEQYKIYFENKITLQDQLRISFYGKVPDAKGYLKAMNDFALAYNRLVLKSIPPAEYPSHFDYLLAKGREVVTRRAGLF